MHWVVQLVFGPVWKDTIFEKSVLVHGYDWRIWNDEKARTDKEIAIEQARNNKRTKQAREAERLATKKKGRMTSAYPLHYCTVL